MPVELIDTQPDGSRPIRLVEKDGLSAAGLDAQSLAWAGANSFSGEAGKTLLLPGRDGAVAGALFGIGASAEEGGALAEQVAKLDAYDVSAYKLVTLHDTVS